MADPVTAGLLIASVAMTGYSTYQQGQNAEAQGKYQQRLAESQAIAQRQAADYNAQVMQMQADRNNQIMQENARRMEKAGEEEFQATEREVDRLSKQQQIIRAANRADAAKSGFSLGESKSFIEVMADTAFDFHMDKNLLFNQGMKDYIETRHEASLLRAEGIFQKETGYFEASMNQSTSYYSADQRVSAGNFAADQGRFAKNASYVQLGSQIGYAGFQAKQYGLFSKKPLTTTWAGLSSAPPSQTSSGPAQTYSHG